MAVPILTTKMIEINNSKNIMGFENFKKFPNLIHFVTTRHGGVSSGTYASFNCSPFNGDNIEYVNENQRRLRNIMGIEHLVIPHQIHGTSIKIIDEAYDTNDLEGVDGLVTNSKGLCLCISTADCVPVFMYDPACKVIAMAHAGWRGTVSNIVVKTIDCMEKHFNVSPANIIAAIGPSISLKDFEIGDEVYQAFADAGFDMKQISSFDTQAQKHHIDLWKANIMLLQSKNVKYDNIECSEISTYSHSEDFFSARRLGIKSGRILSGLMLK